MKRFLIRRMRKMMYKMDVLDCWEIEDICYWGYQDMKLIDVVKTYIRLRKEYKLNETNR